MDVKYFPNACYADKEREKFHKYTMIDETSRDCNFYVEYSGSQNEIELILQSWPGGAEWAKVQASESGSSNGHYYAKYSYNDMVSAFGSNFGKLDRINIGAKNGSITVYSVCCSCS